MLEAKAKRENAFICVCTLMVCNIRTAVCLQFVQTDWEHLSLQSRGKKKEANMLTTLRVKSLSSHAV